ncbi:MAG TPA: PAS domain S-box protein [Mesorhizobium sp.]|jgi:PAS domain S-box-containing protein|nr:PAS domain S-box protein [Mesorhizobium sp.]
MSVSDHGERPTGPRDERDARATARPAGESEMAALVRAHDWASTPLGPAETWPASLKSAVDLVLASPLGMIVLWGPQLVQIYNNGYRAVMSGKHPEGLGQPTAECWPEVWPFNAPVYAAVLRGEARSFLEQKLVIERHGRREDAWFDLTYSPLRDDAGGIAGVLVTVVETTAKVRSEALLREREKSALRESEEDYRRLFTSMAQGFSVIEKLATAKGEPSDYRFVAANPAVERQTGWTGLVGRRVRETQPNVEARILDMYDDVVETGAHRQFINHVAALDAWFDIEAFPARLPGQVAVLFTDISARKRAEIALRESAERHALMLKLSDALRPLNDAEEIIAVASRMLGQHLGAGQVIYAESDFSGAYVTIQREWNDGSIPSNARRHRLDDFGPEFIADLRRGQSTAIGDVALDPRTSSPEALATFARASIKAILNVPLVKSGRLVAVLGVHSNAPHAWQPKDIALAEEVAERTWAAVERARAETALRASEARFQALFTSIDEGFCLAEAIFDAEGRCTDILYLDENPAARRLTGQSAKGRRLSELGPYEQHWRDILGQVARGGQAQRLQQYAAPDDIWYDFYAFKPPEAGENELAVIFRDVTAHKRAEQVLRESAVRQTFLLKLSDALRPLADADEIQGAAARVLGEHMDADRTYYCRFDHAQELAIVERDHSRGGASSVVGRYPFSAARPLLDAMARGLPFVAADVETTPELSEADRAFYAGLAIQAFVCTPIIKNGELVAAMAVSNVGSRHWTPQEVALIGEVAERTWEAVERARAEAALRGSEERHRLIVERVRDYAIFTTDAQGVIATWPPGAESVFGWSAAEAVGQPFGMTFTPEERANGEPEKELAEAREKGSAPNVRWHQRKDGARVFIEGRSLAMRGPSGETTGFLKIGQDVTERRRAENALRESEARFRLMTDAVPQIVWITDAEGRVEFFNQQWENYMGAPRDPITAGEVAESFVHPDDADATMIAFDAARASGGAFEVEHRIRSKSGAYRWFLVRAEPYRDAATGKIVRWFGASTDIHDRKLAEAGLRESEARFRSFADNSADTLWIVNAETGQLEYLSPAFEPMWGEARERVMEDISRWADLVHPDDRPRAAKGMLRLLNGETHQQTYRIVRPSDNAVRFIQDTGFPIRAEGRIERVAGIAQDVTDQKRLEAARIESERRLRVLTEGIPQLVWRSGGGGRWTWASAQWIEFTGLSQNESRGLGWLDALHPDDRARALAAWGEAQASGMLDVEYRIRRAADEAFVWHHTRALPVRDEEDHVLEWLGTSTDIHDLRQLREAQGVLVAELQHRTRNIVTIVRSLADRTAASSASLEDFQERFRARIEALGRVQSLLSKLGEGQRVSFEALVRAELSAHGALDGEAGKVTLDGPGNVRLRSAHVQTLALALHELATNAVKYGALASPEGRLSLRWRVERGQKGRALIVEWAESGVPLPPGFAPKRKGYGRELIERALPYQLKAETRYEIGPDGVRCAIRMPLSDPAA